MSSTPFGVLNINKPLGLTSHDVVSRVRRKFGLKKVGHAGTLDPLATGVLIVCVGPATRLSDYMMATRKQYRAIVRLGETTATDDAEGDILNHIDASYITEDKIQATLPAFIGEIDQLPPMYSAIKQGGKKLYEIARAGETIERKMRKVVIHEINIVDFDSPDVTIDVACGSGTYIRSLARDIGESLTVGAHLVGLTRTQNGKFLLGDAVDLDNLVADDDPHQYLISPSKALGDWFTIVLDPDEVNRARQGQPLQTTNDEEGTLAKVVSLNGELVAIAQSKRGRWHPFKVFS